MSSYALLAVDLVAIAVLVFAVYLPRHRRRDLVVAYLGVNVGVLAVAAVLAHSTVGAGLGLGLFGVLSIIRLRSTELQQHEVAYYFAALALGLIAGLGSLGGVPVALSVGMIALVVAVVGLADTPRLLTRYRQQTMVVDRAIPDETALVAHLERVLGGHVHQATVMKLDLVNDTTTVDVRYTIGDATGTSAGTGPSATGAGAAAPVTTVRTGEAHR